MANMTVEIRLPNPPIVKLSDYQYTILSVIPVDTP